MKKGDKGKKVLGLIVILAIIVSVFGGVVSATTYDPQAAVNYADTWWNGRNPNYYDYSSEGGDCANFASQCLIAGGLDLSGHPNADSWGCIPSCTNLHDYLVNYLGATYETRHKSQVEPIWFVPGDPAIFPTPKHAVFAVTGDATHYATCNAHSTDRYHKTIQWFFDNSNWNSCTYYHIPTDIPTPPAPPTITSPGSSSGPGPTIDTLTPTLQWNSVSNADYYALAISEYPYGPSYVIHNPQQLYGTSYIVPSGVLEHVKKYRWNLQAHNSAAWSDISNTLYFQTPVGITDQQKQQAILNMVNSHRGSLAAELILAIIRQEGGEGAFHVDGWNYNTFYRESDGPWAQPTNGDGIMQVTTASGYHENSGPYTHDWAGYDHAINDGCDYLLAHYNTYGTQVQSTLHYNTGPNSLYIYLGKNWGDRNYLSHVAGHLSTFVPNTYALQNQNIVNVLNQGQNILNIYLYNMGIATGQSVGYYGPYQTQLDSELHNIEIGGPVITSSLIIIQSPPYYVGETITGHFTITNKGPSPITFDLLTIGGRDPDDQVADFTLKNDITLNPTEYYNYQGIRDLTKVGNYHFFCAYRTPDGIWFTNIPTEGGATNVLDITVLTQECDGTDTSCGIYPNCENCNNYDGCYAYGNGCEERDYYCVGNEAGCGHTHSNRHTDYYDDWVYYCSGDTVRRHRLFHNYYCDGGTCTDHPSWIDDQLVENCNDHDGWYCNGNIREYRDYYCSGSSCTYTVTSSENCNDYDCWVDTGNTQWVDVNECQEKEQKEQEYLDYYCSGGACTYSVTGTKWIDTGNTQNKPDGTICGCTASNTLKRCYGGVCTDTGICDATTCGADDACNGKRPGDSCGGGTCDSTCKCRGQAVGEDYGIFSAPLWFVDTNGDHLADDVFGYGFAGARPLVGDINQDGTDDIAVYSAPLWFVDTNGDHLADDVFGYGFAGATPLVGDINQDGTDDIAVFSAPLWFVDTNGDHIADDIFGYGFAGATPLVGDINQDGTDDIAVYSAPLWFVDTNGDHLADDVFGYGFAGATPLVGDINQDGTDDIAVYSAPLWFVDTNGDHLADDVFGYGFAGATPLVGNIG